MRALHGDETMRTNDSKEQQSRGVIHPVQTFSQLLVQLRVPLLEQLLTHDAHRDEILHVDKPNGLPVVIDDRNLVEALLLNELHRVSNERVHGKRGWVTCHHAGDRCVEDCEGSAVDVPPQIPIGEDATQSTDLVHQHDGTSAPSLGRGAERVTDRAGVWNRRQVVAYAEAQDLGHRPKPCPEHAARVMLVEVVLSKIAPLRKREGERIANCKRKRRRCGRRKLQRTSLGDVTEVNVHARRARETRFRFPRHADRWDAVHLKNGCKRYNFLRLARP